MCREARKWCHSPPHIPGAHCDPQVYGEKPFSQQLCDPKSAIDIVAAKSPSPVKDLVFPFPLDKSWEPLEWLL